MKKFFLTILSVLALTFIPSTVDTASAQGKVKNTVKDVIELGEALGIFGRNPKGNTTTTSTKSDGGSTVTVYQEETAGKAVKIESVHPDLKVRVKRCVAVQKMVIVTVQITNLSTEDDNLGFGWQCTAVDDNGNEYNHDVMGLYARGAKAYTHALVSDVNKMIEIRIENVPSSVESIARIVLPINQSNIFPRGNIIMRNIPINRDE